MDQYKFNYILIKTSVGDIKFFLILLCFWQLFAGSPVVAQDKDSFTDPRDGHIYQTINIGNQIWMAENLAFLPEINKVRDLSWDEARYWVFGYYGKNVDEARESECYEKYGVLYNWAGAKEACPPGWRLPEESDWQKLESFLGMDENSLRLRDWRESGTVGKELKSVAGWYNNSGTNEFGFDALPGGLLGYNGFECMNFCSYFWVGTATHRDNAWIRSLCFDKDGIQRIEERKWFGCSVRCVKDE